MGSMNPDLERPRLSDLEGQPQGVHPLEQEMWDYQDSLNRLRVTAHEFNNRVIAPKAMALMGATAIYPAIQAYNSLPSAKSFIPDMTPELAMSLDRYGLLRPTVATAKMLATPAHKMGYISSYDHDKVTKFNPYPKPFPLTVHYNNKVYNIPNTPANKQMLKNNMWYHRNFGIQNIPKSIKLSYRTSYYVNKQKAMPLMISNKPFMRSNINNRVFRTRNYPDMLSYFNKKQVMGRRATDTTLQNIFHRNSPYKNYMSKTFVKTNFSKYNKDGSRRMRRSDRGKARPHTTKEYKQLLATNQKRQRRRNINYNNNNNLIQKKKSNYNNNKMKALFIKQDKNYRYYEKYDIMYKYPKNRRSLPIFQKMEDRLRYYQQEGEKFIFDTRTNKRINIDKELKKIFMKKLNIY